MKVYNMICPDILATNRCNMRCKYCFEPEKGQSDMDIDKLNEYLSNNPCISVFPFGGETLLKLDLICSMIDSIQKNPQMTRDRKEQTIKKARSLIINGTLLTDSNIEILKKYKIESQISVDGPKHVHDKNRVFPDGSGTHDIIMKGIDKLTENGLMWSMHGVVNKSTLPYVSEIAIWFFETYKEKKSIEKAIMHMGKNTFQIIFEEDYDDNDVDILIEEFYKFAKWVYSRDYLSEEQKNELFENFFLKNGGVCSAGSILLALDHNFDIYPCHRLAMIPNKEKHLLGNAFKPLELQNFKLYNTFYGLGKLKKYMYSSITNIHNYQDENKDKLRWFMWCPSTNWQTSGTPYYQSAKYNLMFSELNRAIQEIKKEFYTGKDGHDREQSYC